MAISTTSYFSNALVGVPQVAGEYVDLYVSNTLPKYALGTKYERQDGCIFRYGYFAGITTAGTLVSSTAADVSISYAATSTAIAPASTYQMPDEIVGVYPGSIGSRYLILGITTTGNANYYAGAYCTVVSGTGAGYTYRVRGNVAGGTPATNMMRLNLYDQLVVALDATSIIAIGGNKFAELAASASSTASVVAGVSMVNHVAATWGWVQTQGLCGVLNDAGTTATLGQLLTVSPTVSGAVAAWAATGTSGAIGNANGQSPIVGYCANVGVTKAFSQVYLQLE